MNFSLKLETNTNGENKTPTGVQELRIEADGKDITDSVEIFQIIGQKGKPILLQLGVYAEVDSNIIVPQANVGINPMVRQQAGPIVQPHGHFRAK